MNSDDLIRKAVSQGRLNLNEMESKHLLSANGVPIVKEARALTVEEAIAQAAKIGYPVVLKGMGAQLTHKTECGAVKLDLRTDEDIRKAFREIKEAVGADWEVCLVQQMITGKREFVAGLFRDPQFGPVVMFGLGGVFTEALKDVVFRIAPVSHNDAAMMADGLLSNKLLLGFRGESAADQECIVRILMGLSQLGLQYPEIAEIDINPLIVQPDGGIMAVDALVVLKPRGAADNKMVPGDINYTLNGKKPKEDAGDVGQLTTQTLNGLFNPGSLAVIGASPDENKLGNLLARGFVEMRYAGKLYWVNTSASGSLFGRPVYKNIRDIPGDVTLAVICTPPSTVPEIIEQCAKKSVKGIVLFVTPADDAQAALRKAVDRAKSSGIRISGPNSMGFHNPAAGISIWPTLPARVGPVASICHSGGMVFALLTAIEDRGIGCSKAVSVGNEWDLNWTDYLAYFGEDDQTEIITGYLEGMADGRRFLQVAQGVGHKKPIICVKGGQSITGNQFAGSHTGGMAGSDLIWKAAFDQANIVNAIDFQDLITHVVMFRYLKSRPVGRRIGLVTGTGGPTVITTDLCEQYGFVVPELSSVTKKKFKKLLPPFGSSCRNPVDVSISAAVDQTLYSSSIRLLDQSADVDMIICIHTGDSVGEKVAQAIIEAGSNEMKPLIVLMIGSSENNARPIKMLLEAGIPAFDAQENAVRALSALVKWKERAIGTQSGSFQI